MERQGHRLAYLPHPHPHPTALPIIWIHGLTGSVHFWEAAMYEEVRHSRSWYSVSLPLHYPSVFAGRPSKDSLNEDLLADLLHDVIRACVPTGDFHLAGYSVGGFTALNYAAKYPARVASVISIGGFLTGRARGIEGVLQFFAKGTFFRKGIFYATYWSMQRHRIFFKLATLAYARKWRALLAYPELEATIHHVFPDVQRHSLAGQKVWFHYLLTMNLLDETHAIEHPTLVIAGDRDPVIPYHHQRACAELLPNAELVTLPGVGHVAFAEAAQLFKRTVLAWLDRRG
ncbi:MAG: alpha/beta hydrolase [Bacteroidota bacterium]